MSWTPPFSRFQAGYRTYRVKVCETPEEYLAEHVKAAAPIVQGTVTEKGCTIIPDGLILINAEECHDDEAMLLHTFFHEMLHAIWYAMGRHADEHHNEIEIDNIAGVMTQVYLSRKPR